MPVSTLKKRKDREEEVEEKQHQQQKDAEFKAHCFRRSTKFQKSEGYIKP